MTEKKNIPDEDLKNVTGGEGATYSLSDGEESSIDEGPDELGAVRKPNKLTKG